MVVMVPRGGVVVGEEVAGEVVATTMAIPQDGAQHDLAPVAGLVGVVLPGLTALAPAPEPLPVSHNYY